MTGYDRKPADSLGKQLVGFNFNPSGDQTVANLKGLFAEIIDIVNDLSVKDKTHERLAADAITMIITAQMWSVKAATWAK